MRARHALLLAAAALCVATSASAEDKVVNVYNWSDYIADDTLANFTKETGIKVTYDVYDSMETLEAKVYAGSSGYDVIVPTNPNLERMIKAGVLQPLDKSKLPNDKHQWKFISDRLAAYDPGNKYAEDYMWGTTGIGYNIDKIKAIMPDAPVNSWAMVFDPKIISKFKSCGVYFLDSPDDVIPSMLAYLGLDPNSKNPDDLKKAGDALKAITPYVQKFHSSEYIDALSNGDICMAIGYSGDVFQARDRADEAKNGVHIAYSIPKEGALMWFELDGDPQGRAASRQRARLHQLHDGAEGGRSEFQLRLLRQRQQGFAEPAQPGRHRRPRHLSAPGGPRQDVHHHATGPDVPAPVDANVDVDQDGAVT